MEVEVHIKLPVFNNALMDCFCLSFKKSICGNKVTAEANTSSLLYAAISCFFLASYFKWLKAINQSKRLEKHKQLYDYRWIFITPCKRSCDSRVHVYRI